MGSVLGGAAGGGGGGGGGGGEALAAAAMQAGDIAEQYGLFGINALNRGYASGEAIIAPQTLAGYTSLDALTRILGLPTPRAGSAKVSDVMRAINSGVDARNLMRSMGSLGKFAGNTIFGEFQPGAEWIKPSESFKQLGMQFTPRMTGDFDPRWIDAAHEGVIDKSAAQSAITQRLETTQNTVKPERLVGYSDILMDQPNLDETFRQILELRETPGYQFRVDEGMKASNRLASAMGNLYSGNQLRALTELGQGLADQTYNDRVSHLMSVAGFGGQFASQAAQGQINQGQDFASTLSNIGEAKANALMAAASARAAGSQGRGKSGGGGFMGALGSIAGSFLGNAGGSLGSSFGSFLGGKLFG